MWSQVVILEINWEGNVLTWKLPKLSKCSELTAEVKDLLDNLGFRIKTSLLVVKKEAV